MTGGVERRRERSTQPEDQAGTAMARWRGHSGGDRRGLVAREGVPGRRCAGGAMTLWTCACAWGGERPQRRGQHIVMSGSEPEGGSRGESAIHATREHEHIGMSMCMT